MIDYIGLLADFLEFRDEDDFYFLQILQRKKENSHLGSNSRVIKNYFIGSQEYLLDREKEIKGLCDQFNARAMLRLNRRSYYKTAFHALQIMADKMANKSFDTANKAYVTACGRYNNEPDKKWIIDVDTADIDPDELRKVINNVSPHVGHKTYFELKTKNGYHLITKPFNITEFNKFQLDVSIQKDNPVNMYIP